MPSGASAELSDQTLELLSRLVSIDSPTAVPEQVRKVQDLLAAEFKDLGLDTHWVEADADRGRNVLVAQLPGNGQSTVALLGHADTVFPMGTAAKRPFTVTDGRAHGPGVSDMKGGLALLWSTLATLSKQHGREDRPDIRVVITADEEIGTPYSKQALRDLLQDCQAVLNFEPGRPDGSVVTSRRGSAHLKLVVHGKASHSGADFANGRSAIASLGRIIAALHDLNDGSSDASVNIGIVNGGTATNMVPDHAEAAVHLAYSTEVDGRRLLNTARELTASQCIEGTNAELIGDLSFLPMQELAGNLALYRLFKQFHEASGAPVATQHALGAADAGIPASMGIPTLCGVGPTGGNWHSPEEYMETGGLADRLAATVGTILNAHTI